MHLFSVIYLLSVRRNKKLISHNPCPLGKVGGQELAYSRKTVTFNDLNMF